MEKTYDEETANKISSKGKTRNQFPPKHRRLSQKIKEFIEFDNVLQEGMFQQFNQC